MHLTNEELLELSDVSHEHLLQCDSCKQRAENLALMREKLHKLPQEISPSDNWQQIQASFKAQKHANQISLATKKITFWRRMTIGIAASLIVFLTGQNYWFHQQQQDNLEQAVALAKVVETNSILQDLLASQLENDHLSISQVLNLQVELDIIDKSLQQAYLDKRPPHEKSILWQQRQVLIQSSIGKDTQNKIIKI